MTNPLVNGRAGEYGCDGPWFVRFIEAALNRARGRVLSLRLSLFSGISPEPGPEISFTSHLSRQAAALGVGLLDYSAGFYTVDKRLIYPGSEKGVLPYLSLVRAVVEGLNSAVSVAGNVLDIRQLPELPENMAISIGRAMIADPSFAAKSSSGRHADIQLCTRRGRCHYFSRGVAGLQCGMNPSLGRI